MSINIYSSSIKDLLFVACVFVLALCFSEYVGYKMRLQRIRFWRVLQYNTMNVIVPLVLTWNSFQYMKGLIAEKFHNGDFCEYLHVKEHKEFESLKYNLLIIAGYYWFDIYNEIRFNYKTTSKSKKTWRLTVLFRLFLLINIVIACVFQVHSLIALLTICISDIPNAILSLIMIYTDITNMSQYIHRGALIYLLLVIGVFTKIIGNIFLLVNACVCRIISDYPSNRPEMFLFYWQRPFCSLRCFFVIYFFQFFSCGVLYVINVWWLYNLFVASKKIPITFHAKRE
ncbi:hypothetical protein RFI_06170 [Reticulomyxa filosa]|uniref:Uncharacterized protein n=1 Tax=Reticulomyxa filosa TaxID=46433 RepID=X6NYA6_RETFI|nr:hypothetical protein RFI_06170 [Reticulomyxa filosa]|eukprot:ETO30951.1 hypothetical protein RFI_06170 [Reticulomyxa filosa]